jgi:2,3-bisphosphoglycerate-independent phosphoglycerate mutase
MFELGKSGDFERLADGALKPKTSHTLNPVPFHLYAPTYELRFNERLRSPGLANVAATVLHLMGFEPPTDYERSVLAD